jgi:hypothetical protein
MTKFELVDVLHERIDPKDGNGFFYAFFEPSTRHVWVRDFMGGHQQRVPLSEWLTWEKVDG